MGRSATHLLVRGANHYTPTECTIYPVSQQDTNVADGSWHVIAKAPAAIRAVNYAKLGRSDLVLSHPWEELV